MRILIAHESPAGAGGVESYLAGLMPALAARGHDVAFLHHDSRRHQGPTRLDALASLSASVVDDGLDRAMRTVSAWAPDVCFSHNMGPLDVDERLAARWPTAKMMHGYFGTCVSAHKAHAFPSIAPCARVCGPACLALYLPRRCGQLRPSVMIRQFRWSARQRTLLRQYAHVVVASAHMAAEYEKHGVTRSGLTTAPLFPTEPDPGRPRPLPGSPVVLFAGRMTGLKGGDTLIRAVALAQRMLGAEIELVMAGSGPQEEAWRALAARLGVPARFTGWVTGSARTALFRGASLMAVPSLWPEPFGLAGLDAAVHGVPAVAFDSGGIREWLRDGVNGWLVRRPGDHVALAEAMAGALGDPSELLRAGAAARTAAAGFGIEAHVSRLEHVFSTVVRGRPAVA